MIEYFVNEEKRTVVAKITDVVIGDAYVTVTGKSKCHPEDEWDVKKGTKLARIRSIMKFNLARMKVLKKVINYHESELSKLKDEYSKLNNANSRLSMVDLDSKFEVDDK